MGVTRSIAQSFQEPLRQACLGIPLGLTGFTKPEPSVRLTWISDGKRWVDPFETKDESRKFLSGSLELGRMKGPTKRVAQSPPARFQQSGT